ncbi:MAG TPA: cupin domain-containing protein [Melioribacteraceae bacterium]|nr:cupin domain-containing protein [Melioribacteraceae bacterium]
MVIKKIADAQKFEVTIPGAEKAVKQVLIGSGDGTPNYSMRVFTLQPDGKTPYHAHNYEHLNYIISGTGYLLDVEGKKHPINEGEFALVNANEKHQFCNNSVDKNFVMICLVPKEFE